MKTDIDYAKREVIENKLLAALDDDSKVAIVASLEDLKLLMWALSSTVPPPKHETRRNELLEGLIALRDSAFPDAEESEEPGT